MEEALDVPLEDDSRVPALDAWDEDRFTFDDSDRFEEDSLCSWSTEPESLCNNWRGWKRPAVQGYVYKPLSKRLTEDTDVKIPTLTELSAKVVASHIPFELVEHVFPPVPEQLQLRIAFWSFPDNEEDIRLYSCLANGSSDEFQRGDHLFRSKAVRDPLQIGFHLSAAVMPPPNFVNSREQHNVAVTFDRRRITSCNCTCNSSAYWCSHVVAVCLYRINNPDSVCLRAPVSESLSRLKREQLQKFAQYLISELPQQILPTAQRLLDELLSGQPSAINSVCGAPDPTAGASISDQTSWYLDQKTLHVNIKKILIKFCIPAPMVFSDVNCLSTTAPPAAAEWSSLLRPLRGREPEGMWNLLSIVMEMFKRNDRNAVPLLEIITEECMACEQIVVWWYMTCAALHSGMGSGKHAGANSNAHASQHACSSLCDEIVVLWRLAALNPGISPEERLLLEKKFKSWHSKILDKVAHSRTNLMNTSATAFPGFKSAIQACQLDWDDYPIPGVTYTVGSNQLYHCPFTCFKQNEGNVNQVNSSHAVLNCQPHSQYHSHPYGKHKKVIDFYPRRRDHQSGSLENGYRSSVSSEGFCENEADADLPPRSRDVSNERDDVDSQEGGGSDSASSSDGGPACQDEPARSSERSLSSESNKELRGLGMKEPSQSSEDIDMGVFINPESNPYAEQSDNGAGSSTVYQDGNLSPEKRCPKNSSESLDDVNNDLSSDGVLNKQRDCESEIDSPRRASNDSNTSNSDSPHSGDEYSLYYFKQAPDKPETMLVNSVNIIERKFDKEKGMEDPWDILFARSEGLHAHGHNLEACTLAVRLAEELLANPPDLSLDPSLLQTRGKRRKDYFSYQIHPATHQLSCLASATLGKCAFLCSVLAEVPEHNHLAFRVGMFGLEMARPPASTKPLEVKLANQESELVNLMKRIPLGPQELKIIKQKAEQLRDGTLRSRGEALLPIMLTSFIFDALVGNSSLRENKSEPKNPADEALAFEAAVTVLGLKANVSEADHPLLCEGTRRQRGDLVLTLLMHYKDEPLKLTKIMEKLLDREVHNLIKTPLSGWYYSTSANPKLHSKRFSIPSGSVDEDLDNLASGFLNSFEPTPAQEVPNSLGSRPHSSTSSDLEQGFGSMTLGSNPGSSHSRHKDSLPRFKNKRMYPSIPNQPSEAGAHFMFELAKIVLNKAGGNSSTSLFTQPSTSQHHHGPHRALHFCAFQIGLYALGLHNCVSPNWLSRTYSSHVSWITGQAMEIGVLAISFLINTWEGHLTPPEAASIADRASRAGDPNMVRAAAELALSCLPHAHALNPNEIQRAIVQCKEQSEQMLERSCLTVESAAKGGGVYPEVLFQVAKYWYDLYMRHSPGGQEQQAESETPPDPMSLHFSMESSPAMSLADSQDVPAQHQHQAHQHPHQHQHQHQHPHQHQHQSHQSHQSHQAHQVHQVHQVHQPVQAHQPHQSHQQLPPHPPHQQQHQPIQQLQQIQQIPQIPQIQQIPQHPVPIPPPSHPPPAAGSMMSQASQSGVVMTSAPPTLVPVQYAVPPYSFVHPIHPLPPPPPSRLSVYLPPPPPPPQYQYPTTPPAPIPPQQYFVQGNSQPSLRPVAYPITTMQQQAVSTSNQLAVVQPQSVPVTSAVNVSIQQPGPGPVPVNVTQPPPPPPPVSSGRSMPQQQQQQQQQQPQPQQHQQSQPHRQGQNAYTVTQFRCLFAAYRVGMLALETLARRVHDDRPQAKYARNPPYGDDIKWLLQVAKKLGTHHLHQFCVYVVNSIVSPFILHEVALEAAHFLARNNPSLVLQHLRSSLTPLVQKCQQMYIQCMHQRLYHLTNSDYEEFVNVVCAAKAAFLITPEGTQQFKEWLQSIKRSKSCKKELWAQINTALGTNNK